MKENCDVLNSFMSNNVGKIDLDDFEKSLEPSFLQDSKIASGLNIRQTGNTHSFRGSKISFRAEERGTPKDKFTKISQYSKKLDSPKKESKLVKHGFGVQAWPNGSFYIGFFKDSKRHSHGRLIFENGDFYEGEWQNGKANGYGKYVHEDGTIYEGEFVEDK